MAAFWYSLVGVLLVAIALMGRFLDRLPVSPAMIYLFVGFALGPTVFNVLELHRLQRGFVRLALERLHALVFRRRDGWPAIPRATSRSAPCWRVLSVR